MSFRAGAGANSNFNLISEPRSCLPYHLVSFVDLSQVLSSRTIHIVSLFSFPSFTLCVSIDEERVGGKRIRVVRYNIAIFASRPGIVSRFEIEQIEHANDLVAMEVQSLVLSQRR